MELENIYIENFYSIKNSLEIPIKENKLILVGENGSGKSNILRTVGFILTNFGSYSISWKDHRLWDFRKNCYVQLKIKLQRKDVNFLKNLLFYSLLSINTETDVLHTDQYYNSIKKHYYENNNVIFENITIGLTSEKDNKRRLNSYLITRLSEDNDFYLYIDGNGKNYILHETTLLSNKREKNNKDELNTNKVELIDDVSIEKINQTINNVGFIDYRVLSRIIPEVKEEISDDFEFLKQTNQKLDGFIKDTFSKNCQLNIEKIHEDRIIKYEDTRKKWLDFSLQLEIDGYSIRETDRLQSIFVVKNLLLKRFPILREDRGLILDSAKNTPYLSLDRIEHELFEKKMNLLYEENTLFVKIQEQFKKFFSDITVDIGLKKTSFIKDKPTTLILSPSRTDSYSRYDDKDYEVKSREGKTYTSYYPIIQFSESIENEPDRRFNYGLENAPGGAYEILMVLSALHGFNASTVLIDEPGKTLHPNLRVKLREHIYGQQNQVMVVVTYYPELIQERTLSSLIKCYKNKDGTNIVSLENLILNHENAEKYKKFILRPFIKNIFFANRVLFVEGPTDYYLLSTTKHVIENNLIQLDDNLKHLHKIIDQNWVFTELGGKDNSSKAVDIARELKLTWILLVDHDAFESNPGKTVLESRVGRILHKGKGDCVIIATECPLHADNNGLSGDIEKIKEVVKSEGIYAWKNDLESMVSITKEGFSKNQWSIMSFEERVDLVIELIEKENKEFMEFLNYLVKSYNYQS